MTRRAQALHGMALLLAACLAQAEPIGYVVNSDSPEDDAFSLVRVDLATGAHTVLGDTGYIDVEGLAFGPGGTLYGVDDATKTLLTFDLETGEATPVGSGNGNLGLPQGLENSRDFGLAFDFHGNLWLSSDVTGQVWRVDPETGALQEYVSGSGAAATTADGDGKSHSATQPHLTGLAACGTNLYGISVGENQRLFRLRTDPPGMDEVGALGAALQFDDGGLAFDGAGRLWGIADRSTFRPPGASEPNALNEASIIFTVDSSTGTATRESTTIVGVESLAIAPPTFCLQDQALSHPIPAHSRTGLAFLILALGLGAALAFRDRETL